MSSVTTARPATADPTPSTTAPPPGGDSPDQPSPPDAPAADGTMRLSYSRVDTYQTCPLKFRFGYVDRLPRRPSPELSWGSSLHTALEAWWDQKLPEPPPVEVLYQALFDGWDDSGFADMSRDDKLVWYRHARDVLARHHARHAPSYVPAVATEEWFELDLGDDIEVVGSIDHVTRTSSGGIGIVDWKTNRKAKPRSHVAGSLQLAIYALAARHLWGQEPDWVALDFVVPGVRVTVARQEIDVDGALAAIHDVAASIRAGRFEAQPSRLCDWCDWRAECPAFAGDGPDVPGLAVVELQTLRRRRDRDEARMAELESFVRARLGDDVAAEVSPTAGG